VCRLHSRLLGRKRVSSIIDGDLHVLPLLARRLRSICLRLGSANSNQLCGVSVDLEILEELQDNLRWLIGAEVFEGPATHRAAVLVLASSNLAASALHEPSRLPVLRTSQSRNDLLS
jgi:hypothetical protein